MKFRVCGDGLSRFPNLSFGRNNDEFFLVGD